MDDLIQRIQGLPPEIFNQIQAEVLWSNWQEAEKGHDGRYYRHIASGHKFALAFHVCGYSRQAFAKYYFTRTIFTFACPTTALRYISAVTEKHLKMPSGFRTRRPRPQTEEAIMDFVALCEIFNEQLRYHFDTCFKSSRFLAEKGEKLDWETLDWGTEDSLVYLAVNNYEAD